MPSIDDLKEGLKSEKPASFKKKPYRAWDLGDIQPEGRPEAEGAGAPRRQNVAPDPARVEEDFAGAPVSSDGTDALNAAGGQNAAGASSAADEFETTDGSDASDEFDATNASGQSGVASAVTGKLGGSDNSNEALARSARSSQQNSKAHEKVIHSPPKSTRNLERSPTQTGHNRAQNALKQGTTTGHNRAQTSDQPGTVENNGAQNSPKQGTRTGHNRAQKRRGDKSSVSANLESALDREIPDSFRHSEPVTETSSEDFTEDFEKNRAQNPSVPGSFEDCARLDPTLCPVSPPKNRAQMILVPGSSEDCARLQPGTKSDLNRAQNFSQPGTKSDLNRAQIRPSRPLPSSRQMLAILEFMATQQQGTGLDHTPRLKRSAVAMTLGISLSGIKNQLARLCAGGHLERVEARDGRGDSGTVYRVPSHVLKALQQVTNRAQSLTSTGHKDLFNRAQDVPSTGHKNRAQKPGTNHSSSSVFINTTTTKPSDTSLDKKLYERFHEDIEDLDGKSLVSANDVMQVWRGGSFEDIDDLRESLEHVLAYLRSEAAEGINNKKAWIIKTLGKGYYGKPAGHKSRAEVRLEAQRERAAQRRAQREAAFEADFESWLVDLPPEERKAILGDRLQEGAGFALPPRVLRNTLRDHYAQSLGLFEFVSGEGGAP